MTPVTPSAATATLATPTGAVTVEEADGAIVRVAWTPGRMPAAPSTPLLAEACRQIEAYFRRERRAFDLPLRIDGTSLERGVWEAMRAIPWGETRTYGDLAAALGSNARAVGTACGRNPIPIVIPCHRVVGAEGALTGFSGGRGVATKAALLAHEGALLL